MIPEIKKLIEDKANEMFKGNYLPSQEHHTTKNVWQHDKQEAAIKMATEILNNPSIYLPDYILRSEALVWINCRDKMPEIDNKKPRHYLFLNTINHSTMNIWSEFVNGWPPIITVYINDWEWLSTPSKNEFAIPNWYNQKTIYSWLIKNNYSKEIAEEISQKYADDLQHAFAKGWEKAYNDKEKGTFDYVYYSPIPPSSNEEAGMNKNESLKSENKRLKEENETITKMSEVVWKAFVEMICKYEPERHDQIIYELKNLNSQTSTK